MEVSQRRQYQMRKKLPCSLRFSFPKHLRILILIVTPCRNPLPDPPPFTKERIIKKLKSLSPYKAPGSDGIPNVVLGKCADILAPHLVYIFNSFEELKAFVEAWLYSDMGVLRKPGKASYFFAKCFHPIALILHLPSSRRHITRSRTFGAHPPNTIWR